MCTKTHIKMFIVALCNNSKVEQNSTVESINQLWFVVNIQAHTYIQSCNITRQ